MGRQLRATIMANRRLTALVSGRVQGVNFRWHTRQRAAELGLSGSVRNLRGGRRLEVIAEGSPDQLGKLLLFLHQGPPASRVQDVQVDWDEATGEFTSFGIRF